MMQSIPARSRRGRPSPSETQAKREKVIAVARAAFFEKGYSAAHMGSIAQQAGVSKRSLYLWFSDKEALLKAVLAEQMGDLEIPELDPAMDLRENLSRASHATLQQLSNDYAYKMGRLLGLEAWKSTEVRRADEAGYSAISSPIARALEFHGVPPQRIARLTRFFLAMLLEQTQRRMMRCLEPLSDAEIETEVADAVAVFMGGITQISET